MQRLHLLRAELGDHRTYCGRDTTGGTVDWIYDKRKLKRSKRACQKCLDELEQAAPMPISHASKELAKLWRLNRLSKDGVEVKPAGPVETAVIRRLERSEDALSATALSLLTERKASELKGALESLWNKGLIRKLKRGWLLA